MLTHKLGFKNNGNDIGTLCLMLDLSNAIESDIATIHEYLTDLNTILVEYYKDYAPWFIGINNQHIDLVCINLSNDFDQDIIEAMFGFYNEIRLRSGIETAPRRIVIEFDKPTTFNRSFISTLRNSNLGYKISLIDDFTLDPAWILSTYTTFSNTNLDAIEYTVLIKSPTVIELDDYINVNLDNFKNITFKTAKVFSYTSDINLFQFLIKYGFDLNYATISDFEIIKDTIDDMASIISNHNSLLTQIVADINNIHDRLDSL